MIAGFWVEIHWKKIINEHLRITGVGNCISSTPLVFDTKTGQLFRPFSRFGAFFVLIYVFFSLAYLKRVPAHHWWSVVSIPLLSFCRRPLVTDRTKFEAFDIKRYEAYIQLSQVDVIIRSCLRKPLSNILSNYSPSLINATHIWSHILQKRYRFV